MLVQREIRERLFTYTEMLIFGIVSVAAIAALVALVTGVIAL